MLTPVPVVTIAPGVRVRVHVPEAGRPLNVTLPVETRQVGWTIAPTTGDESVPGWLFITTFPEGADIQPAAVVTVNV